MSSCGSSCARHSIRQSVVCGVLLALLGLGAVAQPLPDFWSSPVTLLDEDPGSAPNGWAHLAPIHLSLMPNGSVMVFGWRQSQVQELFFFPRIHPFSAVITPDQMIASPKWPTSLDLETFTEPAQLRSYPLPNFAFDTLFCSGHAPLADGRLFVAGGLRKVRMPGVFVGGGGTPFISIWNHLQKSWTPANPTASEIMAGTGPSRIEGYFNGPERYYGTVTRLADGRMLIAGGSQIIGGPGVAKNLSVETWDAASGFTVLSNDPAVGASQTVPHVSPAEIFNVDYTHVFALPSPVMVGSDVFDVLMIGEQARPVFMSSMPGATTRWSGLGPQRPVGVSPPKPNKGASSVLLPLRLPGEGFGYTNGAVLCAGGEDNGTVLDRIDVYDPATQTWNDPATPGAATATLGAPRHHPNVVLLPDGKIFVTSGHEPNKGQLLLKAEYIDPRNGFTVLPGLTSGTANRGYHAVALLLPDGRVMVGGGRAGGTPVMTGSPLERADFEFVEPPYFGADRPTIQAVSSVMDVGQNFELYVDRTIQEVVLISLSSMTHSFDMNQRSVQLEIVSQPHPGEAVIAAPSSPLLAPPGYYMLFALDANLTPSEARIVQVR